MKAKHAIKGFLVALIGLLSGACLMAAEIMPEQIGGNLVFSNDYDGEYSQTVSGTTGIVKNGGGKLTLTGQYSSSGEIVINGGTLAVAPGLFTGSTRPNVTVGDSATFDVSGDRGAFTTWSTVFPRITIAGSGDGGSGAIKRTSGGQLSYLTGELMLSASAKVNIGVTTGFKTVTLNGYKLTKAGSGVWHVISGDVVASSDAASVSLDEGEVLMQNSGNGFLGSTQNVIYANGASKLTLANVQTKEIPWALNVVEAFEINSTSDNAPADDSLWSRWNGPITLSGTKKNLTLKSGTNHALNILGAVTGLDGGDLDITSGKVRFHDSVNLSQNGSWSGRIKVQADATAVFSGGIAGSSGEFDIKEGSYIEFLDNGYFARRIGNGSYLRGTLAKPARIRVENSVFDSTRDTMLGDVANVCGLFEIGRNAIVSNHFVVASCSGGASFGAVYQEGGYAYADQNTVIGRYANNYGYYGMTNGIFKSKTTVGIGEAGMGVLRLAGDSYEATVKTSAAGGTSEVLVSKGTGSLNVDLCGSSAPAGTTSLLAIEGSNTVCSVGSFSFNGVNSVTGLVAVSEGGVFRANRIAYSTDAQSGQGQFYIHVNGGVLEQSYGYDWDGGDNKVIENPIIVHEKGCILSATAADDCNVRFKFAKPTGYVVESIDLPTDEAFAADRTYIGPPVVKIEGEGTGAAAVAVFDRATRTITGIRVLSPGTGYGSSGTVAKIASSNGSREYACAVTVKLAPSESVGLIKRGPAKMTINRDWQKTWNGTTSVEEGTLRMYYVPSTCEGLAVSRNAVLDLNNKDCTASVIEGGGTITNANITVAERITLAQKDNETLVLSGALVIADGAEVVLTGSLADLSEGEDHVLLEAKGGIVAQGDVIMPEVPEKWQIRVRSNKITLGPKRGMILTIR